MAIDITSATPETSGGVESLFFDKLVIDLDNSYPTGGYPDFLAAYRAAVAPRQPTIVGIVPLRTAGYIVEYDAENDTLMLFQNGAIDTPHEEVPNATDLAAVTLTLGILAK